MEEKKKVPEFTSFQSRWERIFAIGYLPMHLVIVPSLMALLLLKTGVDQIWLNFAAYSTALLFMLITQWKFLRREFDALCDNFFGCIIHVLWSYGAMLCFNLAVSSLVLLISGGEVSNPNNEAVVELSRSSYGPTAAMAIFIAPIVEELMFRAGLFGWLRKYSRVGAYIVCMLAFSLYHVWAFALQDPMNLLYIVQYLPVSFLLCRCYERSNTIWTPIFFHMLVNGVSVVALNALEVL